MKRRISISWQRNRWPCRWDDMEANSGRGVLRDYQLEMTQRLFDAWQKHRSVMVQMPTGTGKTYVLAEAIGRFLKGGSHGCVWIVAHRRELVAQVEETIGRYGGGDIRQQVRAMSIQWLVRHWEDAGEAPSLIVVDEAHHVVAESYRELWVRYPDAKMLGMTATPCRMNHRAFTDLFEVLLTAWPIGEFIRKGHLALFDYVSIRPDSEEQRLIDGLEKRGADGDYQQKEMDAVLNRRPSIERLYRTIEAFAPGKKGIVYAIGIGHARSIAAYYREKGLEAVAIDSRTPAAERKQWVEDFKDGRIKVLVNVDVFSEGFDCPDVEFVQMARPTRSLAKYLQQVGRGLRKVKGKGTCVLLDNVGLYRMFGLPIVAWDWEAMFRGIMAGKAVKEQAANYGCGVSTVREVEVVRDEMELVLTHEQLSAAIEQLSVMPVEPIREKEKMGIWQEETSGLWGLKRGRTRLTEAQYKEVFDIGYGRAAVRFGDGTCGLVDEDGTLLGRKERYRSMKFRRNELLEVSTPEGETRYVDLVSLKRYKAKPEVKKWGAVELLKVGNAYYSRTKEVYMNAQGMGGGCIKWNGFFLSVLDRKAPIACVGQAGQSAGFRYGHACILAGDEERFYWMYRWLDDGSIVVKDTAGRYFYAEEGQEKRYVGCEGSQPEWASCEREIEHLTRRAEERQRKREADKAERKRERLSRMEDITPFKAGLKWGLKAGSRIVVPPIYRSMRPPVGRYCIVEKEYSRWGVIAVDGTVLVEPIYREISIGHNGTAQLTSITGKTISVKL